MYPVVIHWICTGYGWKYSTRGDLDKAHVEAFHGQQRVHIHVLDSAGKHDYALGNLRPEYQHKSIEEIKIMLEMKGLKCT